MNQNQVIFVSPARLKTQKRNSGQFQPTILLTQDAMNEVVTGRASIRKGQWVLDGRSGRRGQFVGLKRARLSGKTTTVVREAKPGMSFADYQAPLAA